MISFSPSEEQQMIVTMVKQFANDGLREVYRECDEKGEIPSDIVNTAWEIGLVSTGIPEAYGGGGGEHSAVTGSLIAEALAWGDLAIAMHILSPALMVFPILEMGTAEQKKKNLPAFCGSKFAAATAALTEPRFDFDPTHLSVTASPEGGGYVLNGVKCYVPLAVDSEVMLVYAAENGSNQGFVVHKGAKGLEIIGREGNMGIKALATYKLNLRNCKVSGDSRLGGKKGCDFNRLLNRSRVALTAMAVGVASAAFEYSRDYAKERMAFGEPIAARQAIAFMLADMATEIDATRLINWEAAWELDRRENATREASLAKMYADEMVMMVTDYGVQILGGHGYIREHPVELWFRNGRGFATFNGLAIV